MHKKPLVAHEAPFKIMADVQAITDYDYCLVHLLEEDPRYLQFFRDAKDKGRHIIMDCSLFELGHAFDPAKYFYWLKEIQPDEYIIPDVWQDFGANLESYKDFNHKFNLSNLKGKRIGVLQGKTYTELADAYEFMDKEADKIAISFGYDFYLKHIDAWKYTRYWDALKDADEEFTRTAIKPTAYAKGRLELVKDLILNGTWNPDKPHHLLGCGIPVEFNMHECYIESIDTSHPVMTGFYRKSYEKGENRWSKIHNKMVDVYYQDVDQEQWSFIKNNIEFFKHV
jgi:hypothetical protein